MDLSGRIKLKDQSPQDHGGFENLCNEGGWEDG
jgi:hypothetical protein